MIKADVALDSMSIVVKGRFNAAIFSPLWFLQQELIGASDFSKADIEMITSEFASFSTGWLQCQVVPDALQLITKHPTEFERLRDVAVGILNTLPHTPISALGINRAVHFATSDLDQYLAIGDRLVPKQFWEDLVALPITRQVAVVGERPDVFAGRLQVQVEPSQNFPRHIFVAQNDHFDLTVEEVKATSRTESWIEAKKDRSIEPSADKIPMATDILMSVWAVSVNRADDIVNAIARIR